MPRPWRSWLRSASCAPRGIAVVWIEHVVHALLQVAEQLVCLTAGRVIASGEPQAVMRDPAVIEAYLGSAS